MNPTIICFGEVLWDIFPNSKRIGGAPLNVSLRLQNLGISSHIISKIGNDSLGNEILEFLKQTNSSRQFIQIDNNLETGSVIVTLNKDKNATYRIKKPAAWDNIYISNEIINLVSNCDCFVFGSLAARSTISRQTLQTLLSKVSFSVYDVNFRKPFYSKELAQEFMKKSDFIKLNEDELEEIYNWFSDQSVTLKERINYISAETNTNQICVTLGAKGAILLKDNTFYSNDGYQVNVVDTVGAGDSFLAVLLSKLLTKTPTQEALDFACYVGAQVASCEGANPKIDYSKFD